MATEEKKNLGLKDDPSTSSAQAPGSPLHLTDDTLDAAIAKYPFLVVDFWAQWCGPCKMIGPIIEKLAKEHAGSITFGKVDVDTNQKAAASYGILSIPNLIIFKDGKKVGSIVGALPESQLLKKINEYK